VREHGLGRLPSPVEDDWNNCTGHDIYSRCKQVDGCPEKDGSTVRAGVNVIMGVNFGLIELFTH